ncbi:MAG: hypothetical protein CMB80_24570 [Flammeovirgaceae bacterium]|nr:hypothetical protein [Flammeovirgaceae bacterium]
MTQSHLNHVSFFGDEDTSMNTIGTNTVLYTPPTGYVFEVKHIIISPEPGADGYVDIYDSLTTNATDQRFRLDWDDTNLGGVIHLKDLSGFYFGKGFNFVTDAAGNCSVAVSGILK